MLTSDGVATFPDVNVDPRDRHPRRAGADRLLRGLPADHAVGPVARHPSRLPGRARPAPHAQPPTSGDLGLGAGAPQSVYALDQTPDRRRRLSKFGDPTCSSRARRGPCRTATTVEFVGTEQWITVSVRHDPGQPIVPGRRGRAAGRPAGSLTGKRRRVFFRITPTGMSAGGLPRSDHPGFAEEFAAIVAAASPCLTGARTGGADCRQGGALMGGLSNQLLVVTIFSYVLAMLAYAVEYAFGARSLVGQRVLVGAGGPVDPTFLHWALRTHWMLPTRGVPPTHRVLLAPGRRASLPSASPSSVTWPTSAHWSPAASPPTRAPWGNMYEFVMTATLVGVSAWLVVLAKWRNLRHLGLFVTLVASILLAIAGMTLYVPVGPLVPALQSYWLVIHVGGLDRAQASSSSALCPRSSTWSSAASTARSPGQAEPSPQPRRAPPAGRRARAGHVPRARLRLPPIWTFGVFAGAIWAEAAWGRYWNWDPKEVWSFIAWVVYACYLHARSTPSVSRRITSFIAIVGWLTMLVNLFGVTASPTASTPTPASDPYLPPRPRNHRSAAGAAPLGATPIHGCGAPGEHPHGGMRRVGAAPR